MLVQVEGGSHPFHQVFPGSSTVAGGSDQQLHASGCRDLRQRPRLHRTERAGQQLGHASRRRGDHRYPTGSGFEADQTEGIVKGGMEQQVGIGKGSSEATVPRMQKDLFLLQIGSGCTKSPFRMHDGLRPQVQACMDATRTKTTKPSHGSSSTVAQGIPPTMQDPKRVSRILSP